MVGKFCELTWCSLYNCIFSKFLNWLCKCILWWYIRPVTLVPGPQSSPSLPQKDDRNFIPHLFLQMLTNSIIFVRWKTRSRRQLSYMNVCVWLLFRSGDGWCCGSENPELRHVWGYSKHGITRSHPIHRWLLSAETSLRFSPLSTDQLLSTCTSE